MKAVKQSSSAVIKTVCCSPFDGQARDLYRKLHLPAKIGRQTAQELVKAGLVVEVSINGAEGYIASAQS